MCMPYVILFDSGSLPSDWLVQTPDHDVPSGVGILPFKPAAVSIHNHPVLWHSLGVYKSEEEVGG